MKHTPLVFVLLSSSVAIAQPYGAPAYDPNAVVVQTPDPLRLPGFVSLDRGDGNSRAGAELSYLILDGNADGTAMRFDVHGQFIDPATGFGGYGYLPMSIVSGNDDTEFELGGAEVGGLLAKRLSPEMGIVGRIGVVLPTASDDALLVNAITAYARPTDLINAFPETSLRISGSPLFRSGQLFARLDVGVDFIVSGEDDDDNALLRIGPGIGFDGGTFSVTGEIVTLRSIGDGGGDDDFVTIGAVGARFTAGQLNPYVGIVLPFDEELRDFVNASLTVGVEAKL